MSILRKDYEISVWNDVWESGKFVEKRLGIIGSNSMSYEGRAIEPNFSRNVNGVKKLSFKMYKYFIDPITGEKALNPFVNWLVSERKVKLKYEKCINQEGKEVLAIAENESFVFAEVDQLGQMTHKDYLPYHVNEVLQLPLVDVEAIKKRNFTVAIDCVNSVGGLAIPAMLKALGVTNIIELYCEPNGQFPHNPEPLPQHLTEISELLKQGKADLGFVVDPDVDRLAIICEDGSMFGEEYTLVSIADYILAHTPGNTVSNMSSSRALSDITRKHGGEYTASAVGEVNVVAQMQKVNAIIGGEGNGGVIYPACHSGRDALVGVALFLSHMAKMDMTVSAYRQTLPEYYISKNRIDLTPDTDIDAILARVKDIYKEERVNDIDGVKIDFAEGWVHLRKSNTEPIIRVYSEAATMDKANALAQQVMAIINE